MSSIMGLIGLEKPELSALEFRIIALLLFVKTLAYTNINQSEPYLVKMCMTIPSQTTSILGLIAYVPVIWLTYYQMTKF